VSTARPTRTTQQEPNLTPPQQQAGSVLDGKYEVLDHLGGGGMGEVYLVRHIHLEEKRVVKILRPDRVSDPDAQKRFLREARFATQIKHPHVAILYDYSRLGDGSFYMVWEYIEGEDVGTRVRRDGPLPVDAAVDLAIQALRGLDAIHGAGMIHRDISPDNLMIYGADEDRPQLKIIDLGLAKNLEPDPDHEVTQDGMFMGKLLYCAPEQAGLHKGETLDNRTDLYSMSLVLYEMLTGLPPFEAETPQGAIFKRLSEDPLPLAGRNPEQPIGPTLEAVVLRGLARERDDRFPNAARFIEALERAKAGEPVADAQTQAGARHPVAGSTTGSRELTRSEKNALLAQIEAAARRQRDGSKRVDQVEALLSGGRLDEARSVVERLQGEDPRSKALPELEQRLAAAQERITRERRQVEETKSHQRREALDAALAAVRERIAAGDPAPAREALESVRSLVSEAADGASGQDAAPELERAAVEVERLGRQVDRLEHNAAQRQRVDEASALVERYLKTKQIPLARLALETLLELAPTHPKRSDYEHWIELVDEEAEQEKEAAQVLADARELLRADDPRGARRSLSQLEKLDPDQADVLRRELEAAEADREKTAELDAHRERLQQFLEERKIEEAQQEIKAMADLGAAKVTLDLWRARLEEARTSAVGEAQAAVFREAFRERLEHGDFAGARSVAGEYQRTSPDDPRPAELFAEVARLEQERERSRAIAQGESQVDEYIEEGDAGKAELALKVLLQLAPDHKRRKQFEKKIAKLKR